jgi:alpha-mannosidase
MSAVREGCGGGIVIDDPSDTWSHGVDRFREEVGRFELVGTPEVLEAGPLRWKARAVGRYRDSWLIQEISLFEGRSEVYACAEVRWHEKHRMLKLAVPTCIVDGRGTFEIAYGAIERPQTGDEEPGQRWADLSGVPAGASGVPCGVALLNDGKYGFDVQDGEIRMSVLRSPIYAFHDPAQVQPGESYEYMEQGVHVFRYAIAPHAGDWRAAGIPRLAAAFNRPCLALHEPAHGGPLPPTYSFASTNSSHVDVETVKPAECGEGVTLRLRETFGEATDCVLTLTESQAIPLTFAAWEIKTLVARRVGDQWLVRETDLLERGGNFGDRQSR